MKDMDKKIAFMTLGCKVNKYDTEAVIKKFKEDGYKIVEFTDKADVYVINTCTVTNLSNKKSRQLIRKVKKINEQSVVVAMGCYSQVSPNEVVKIEGVNIVVGTKNRLEIPNLVRQYNKEKENICTVTDILKEKEFEKLNIDEIKGMTRCYIKVQDGCNQFCTFCIIPFARGGVRSRDLNEIIEESTKLGKNGIKEVVLTGIHIASYGVDLENMNLIKLITEINKIEGIERIRLSSVEPNIITEQFLEQYFSLEKTCNSFHLSLQSGSDDILKAMRRKYNTKEFLEAVKLIRKHNKNCSITTDIIVGFPNESEGSFLETMDFAREVKFSKIHVFPYSKKEGTKASDLKGHVLNSIKTIRAKKLRGLSAELEKEFLNSHVGETVEILFEKEVDGWVQGHTKNFIMCKVDKKEENDKEINKIINAKVIRVDNGILQCEI